MASRKLASASQILWAAFGHCADFPGGCFIPLGLFVRFGGAKIRADHHCPARMGRENRIFPHIIGSARLCHCKNDSTEFCNIQEGDANSGIVFLVATYRKGNVDTTCKQTLPM